jgi:hypothetical protein
MTQIIMPAWNLLLYAIGTVLYVSITGVLFFKKLLEAMIEFPSLSIIESLDHSFYYVPETFVELWCCILLVSKTMVWSQTVLLDVSLASKLIERYCKPWTHKR